MKKIFVFIQMFFCLQGFGQQNAGIGTTTPDASAILHINSTTKGLLIPRMSTADRALITTPANGLEVFDTDLQNFWYYDAVALAWKELNGTNGNLPAGATGNTLRHNGAIWITDNYLNNDGARIGIGIPAPTEGLHIDSSMKIGRFAWSTPASSRYLKIGDGDFITLGEDSLDDRLYFRAREYVFDKSSPGYTGNVGIGTSGSPTAKLHVNGTVRITEGNQALGKVLTSDANGNATWQEASCMQRRSIFGTPGSGFTFTVPAGVTRLFIELWGGGGSGSVFNSNPAIQVIGGGGGSGGYANLFLDVTPASTITINVGSIASGWVSGIAYLGNTLFVNNGGNAGNILGPGNGGTLAVNSFSNVLFIKGNYGDFNLNTVYTIGATTYTEYRGGKGGDAPNGGGGGFGEIARSGYNSGSDIGAAPGGGGGASTSNGTTIKSGGNGMVIIRY